LACIYKVGQNCISTPHLTVHLVVSLPKIPDMHRLQVYGSGQPCVYTVYTVYGSSQPCVYTV
jgi:hypothetical protein